MEMHAALLAICEGNPSVTDGFTYQRPVIQNCNDLFVIILHKLLDKQLRAIDLRCHGMSLYGIKHYISSSICINTYMGQVTKVRLSSYLVLLSNDSKTR